MITVKNIQKAYGNKSVLKDVSFSCETGKIQALLGANGAGKTTLVNILSGLLEKDKGTCSILETEITRNEYLYKEKVGYVLETPIYVEIFTAKEYLEFVGNLHNIPKNELKKRIEELLSFFELPDTKKDFIKDFSKGMKSKMSMAAALIHNPSYLILDEPFDGMDFVSVQKVGGLLKNMRSKGATILLTSHQYDIIAETCDFFALLKDGKILFNTSLEQLGAMSKDFDSIKNYLEHLMSTGNDKSDLNFIDSTKKTNTN
jgi:ABC-2 type transport system ATP-binding protein